MRRLVLVCLAAAVLGPASAIYAVSALGASAADGKLFAAVGPGNTIELKDASGQRVTRLDPGTYEIEIDDRSSIHNFHVYGAGGVDAGTEVTFVGVRTITVTFVAGQYTFLCDEHPYEMIGQFSVGTTPTTSTTTTGTTTLAGRLVGTVGPGATITLKKGTVKVRTLKRGLYSIVVNDRSAFHNFHLKGPGVDKTTGVAFVGKRTWRVRLRAGSTYRYFCNPHKGFMSATFRVT